MRDYSDLEKRLRAIADSDQAKAILLVRMNEPTGKPDWTPFQPSESLAHKLIEAAAAIAELTKRCEEAYADCADIAGRAADTRYALTGTRLADFVRGRTAAAETIREASQRQLPRNPLPNDPANGDENAPGDAVKRGFD